MDTLHLYYLAGIAVLSSVTIVWLISIAIRDASIIDVFWGPLFVVIAWTLFAVDLEAATRKQLVVVFLVTAWGLRLAFHLGARNFGRGEDSRYRLWREHGQPHWWLKSYVRVYLLQGTIALVVATPIIAAFRGAETSFLLGWIGVPIWAIGFVIEASADIQLTRFKARPDSKLLVLNDGLWRHSRHPNYFGDALQWWGLGLLTFTVTTWWSFLGPLAMTLVFLNLSNKVIERGLLKRRPDYATYISRTNAFFPKLLPGHTDH